MSEQACALPTAKYPDGRMGTAAGYFAHRKAGETPCTSCLAAHNGRSRDARRALPDEHKAKRRQARAALVQRRREAPLVLDAPICAQPTLKHPEDRTGTSAGYQAHRDHGEAACAPCLTAHSARSLARRRQLPLDELARHRMVNAASARMRREREPELVRAEKRRRMDANRAIIRAAKNKPCADCGVQYPYYVMQFDHRDPSEKRFNIGQLGPTGGQARLAAEIAKCDVVCGNCHAERTHQAMQSRRSRRAR